MRILLVTDWTSNEGGIETYVGRAADALRADGHDVRLLTSSAGSAANGEADYVAFGTDVAAAQAVLQIANPFAIATLSRAVRDFDPDVVVVNMFEQYLSPAIFQAMRGVPRIAFVHYYKPVCPTALKVLPDGTRCRFPAGVVCWRSGCVGLAEWVRDRPRYALIRSGLVNADAVLACSRWVAADLALNGIAARAVALPVPPPSPSFARSPANHPTFVYVGRLNREKGPDVLMRAFAGVLQRHPNARLRILGGGHRLPELVALARGLEVSHAVSFPGQVAFREVEAAFSDAWNVVAPSVWPEPLGLVAIEAITRGVPVIATASGGFGETVEDGVTGSLVPNGDQPSLTRALLASADQGPTAVPADAAATLQARHDPAAHAATLVGLAEVAIARRAAARRRASIVGSADTDG